MEQNKRASIEGIDEVSATIGTTGSDEERFRIRARKRSEGTIPLRKDRKRNGKRRIRRGHELRGARGEEGVAEVGVRSCYAAGNPELSLERSRSHEHA